MEKPTLQMSHDLEKATFVVLRILAVKKRAFSFFDVYVVGWRRTDGRVILCPFYHFSTSHLTHDGFFCFGTYCTHVQTCDNVRVQSATEWSASVHTAHMSKPVITFVFKVLRNGVLRYILHTCPKL